MKPYEIGQCLALATELETKYPSSVRVISAMLVQMETDMDRKTMTAADRKSLCRLAGRIYDLMPCADEPRFSMHDYADAVVHARSRVDPDKLWKLDDEDFIAAMVWLAADKRETYEDREHCQEPLELDIYASGRETEG